MTACGFFPIIMAQTAYRAPEISEFEISISIYRLYTYSILIEIQMRTLSYLVFISIL